MGRKEALRSFSALLLLSFLTSKSGACDCEGTTWISEDMMAGQIRSPNYPSNYCDSQTCTWGIKRLNGWGIRLVLDDFNIEATHDMLIINEYRLDSSRRGNQLVSSEIASLTGCFAEGLNHCFDLGHQFVTPSQWNISDAVVRFEFSTDESGTRSGFQFSFARYFLNEPTTSTSTVSPSPSVILPPSACAWHHILIAIVATIIALCALLLLLIFAIGLLNQRRSSQGANVDEPLPPLNGIADYNAARDEVGLMGLSHKGCMNNEQVIP